MSKNIPSYAIAVGCPIEIMSYRFEPSTIESLKKIEWWNFDYSQLAKVEQYFFKVEEFIDKIKKQCK